MLFRSDVEERGLSEKILLVVTGEMGRTPTVNKAGGRDHWGNLTPLLLAGGGLKTGVVVGQSDKRAGEPATEPYGIKHVAATVLQTLLNPGEVRIQRGVPDDVARLVAEEPIRELV